MPDSLLVIDEFQRVPELALMLKLVVDEGRSPGRFLITGSVNLLPSQSGGDSLAGRLVSIELRGLSQGEIEGRHEDFVAAVAEPPGTGGRPPKYVLNDPGLGVWLTRTRASTLKDLVTGQALGGFLESFVAAELLRQQEWADEPFTMCHYRSPDGREIDLVLELDDSRIVAIEVKAASSVSAADTRHLRWLEERLGSRLVAGVVLTTDSVIRPLGGRLWSLPVAALWRLG